MLSRAVLQRQQQLGVSPLKSFYVLTNMSARSFASKFHYHFQVTNHILHLIEATVAANTTDVKLQGKLLKGRQQDLPTMIWLPEITEPAENFQKFFSERKNKVLDVRNVWLLNYRNQGGSDHHASYDMEDVAADIIRFMDKEQITMATIGGHGFGAKVAAATAAANLDRFTGVIQYEGGPLNHQYYEAYQELDSYVQYASKLDVSNMEGSQAIRAID